MNQSQTATPKKITEKKRLPLACKIIYLLALVSAGLYFLFMRFPSFSDWFNRYISQFLRMILAWQTVWIPFSLAEMMIILIPFFMGLMIVIGIKHFCESNRSLLVYLGILFSILCVVGILFVWNFAPGYYNVSLDEKLELQRTKSSAEDLYDTAELLANEIKTLENEIIFLENGRSLMPYSYEVMNQKLLDAYDQFCQKHDFLGTFYSRVKPVMLSEPMTYTHITGVYTFFTGEANVNIHFPDYTIPFTAAHELAHQRGIAREDEANFIAFLICMESDDPYIRYSGALNLYEYVGSALYRANADLYWKSYRALPQNVINEEVAYSKFFDQYRDNVAADISQATNNFYLQSQGAPDGTRSYGLVVDLAVAYFRQKSD